MKDLVKNRSALPVMPLQL